MKWIMRTVWDIEKWSKLPRGMDSQCIYDGILKKFDFRTEVLNPEHISRASYNFKRKS